MSLIAHVYQYPPITRYKLYLIPFTTWFFWLLLLKLCFGRPSRKMDQRNLANVVQLNFMLSLENRQVWPLKSYNRPMGNILYPEPKFFAGTNHLWKAENTLKMNTVQGGLQLRKPTKTSNVWTLVRSDRCLTLWMLSEQLNLSRFTVQQILIENLHMRKVCAKMVPKNLTIHQKNIRKNKCLDLLNRISNEQDFYNCVITSDESCIFEFTAKCPRPKKIRMSKSKIKSILIYFFDWKGIVHKEFVPPGQTVNQVFNKDVLERLRKRVIRVKPDIADKWMLHHDNAPYHTVLFITECFNSKGIPVVPQPPYLPDLSSCDFLLFPKLKNVLKGQHFGT